MISTVDAQARHGRKSSAHGFDGYKGHVGLDPDSEIITATTLTAGNVGDSGAARALLAYDLPAAAAAGDSAAEGDTAAEGEDAVPGEALAVYGDAAYGAGELLQVLDAADATVMCKVQPPAAPAGRFAKDMFSIDLTARTVRCPAGATATIARPGPAAGWPPSGRPAPAARSPRSAPPPRAAARSASARTRSKMRRRHGGRRARVRGQDKIKADLLLLAAAVNLARLAVLKLVSTSPGNWATATARALRTGKPGSLTPTRTRSGSTGTA